MTGGSGFIGSALVRKLLARRRPVRVLVRPGHEAPRLEGLDIEMVFGDVRDYRSLVEAFKSCDSLYHLAANPNLWAPDPSVFEEVNYQGTLNVLRAAEAVGTFKKIVYTSSANVIKKDPYEPAKEVQFLDKLEEAIGAYSRSKLLAGWAVQRAAQEGLPIVIVVPTTPLGPGDLRLTPSTRMLLNFLHGKIKAVFDSRLNIVDVRDAAEGHVRAEEKGEAGELYLLGGTNLTLSELFAKIAEIAGLPFSHRNVPPGAALAFAWLSEFIATHITRKPPLATVAGVKLARQSFWFDNTATIQKLGISFRPLEDSLSDAIRDLKERGLVKKPIQ